MKKTGFSLESRQHPLLLQFETVVTDLLIDLITSKLLCGEKCFMKIVFVGVNKPTKKKFEKVLHGGPFSFAFINDFEKAKEWLIP